MIKKLFVFILTILLIAFSYVIIINLLRRRCNNQIIFSHGNNENGNTIKYIDDSIKKGFKGVEIDILYIKKLKDFILAHDYDKENIKNKNYILLKDVFKKYKNSKVVFWLDLKNLKEKNYKTCKQLLESYMKEYSINFFLESANYKSLFLISLSSNIKTSHWIDNKWDIFLPQNFDYISMSEETYYKDKLFYDLFCHVPINIFTVNSIETIHKLNSQNNISCIITDLNISNIISR